MGEFDIQYTPEQQQAFRTEGLAEIQPYIEKWIKQVGVRRFVRLCLENAPLYFWRIPASSTGKYHPLWSQGAGGLLRHVVVGMYNASELARTFGLNELQSDIAVAAMAIHDTCKYGLHDESDVAYYEAHTILPRIKFASKRYGGLQLQKELPKAVTDQIFDAVDRHMGTIATGEWINVGSDGRFKPENAIEYVVHLSDYMASRKDIYFRDFLPDDVANKEGV